jgi:glycerophosphoryl diester phosphodiesterase
LNAGRFGVDVIEMDLRATSDGAIVVMHDTTVDCTTNGTGRISEMTLTEVRKLDAGYRFTNASGQFALRGRASDANARRGLARLDKARLNLEMKAIHAGAGRRLCG